jgi:hypothetical protein
MQMTKAVMGLVLLVAIAWATDHFLVPITLTLDAISSMPVSQLTKLFEAIVVMVMISGFTLQELMHLLPVILRSRRARGTEGARWSDLTRVLVAIFGSAALYIAMGRLGDW